MKTPPVLTLPNELIDQIIGELSDKHLGDLRVTCTRMYDVSLETWKKRALQDKDGRPALNWAAEYNHPSLIHYLCTEFPDIAIDTPWGAKREIPLHIACERRSNEAAMALIDYGADVNYATGRLSALMEAIYNNNATLVQMLLEHNADSRVLDYNDSNIIHAAARRSRVQTLQVILDRMRAYPESMPGINDYCLWGLTALHRAAEDGAISAATLLLDYGADIDSTDARLVTPLGIAARNITDRTVSMATLLLSRGANIEGRTSENTKIWFDTPLHAALRSTASDSYLVVRLLLAHGAAINSIAASGETTMMLAVHGEHAIEYMRHIIDRGGDINTLNFEGSSAVHSLADSYEEEFTQDTLLFLQKNGADMFLANKKGLTPRDLARDWKWDWELFQATWGNGFCCSCCGSRTQWN